MIRPPGRQIHCQQVLLAPDLRMWAGGTRLNLPALSCLGVWGGREGAGWFLLTNFHYWSKGHVTPHPLLFRVVVPATIRWLSIKWFKIKHLKCEFFSVKFVLRIYSVSLTSNRYEPYNPWRKNKPLERKTNLCLSLCSQPFLSQQDL